MTEWLRDIALESVCATLPVPPCKSVTLEALAQFGTVSMAAPFCIAALAALCGLLLGFGVGHLLNRLRLRHQDKVNFQHYDKAQHYVLRFLSPFLLVYWIAPFQLVALFVGFFGMRLWPVVVLILCGAALHGLWLSHIFG
jgi:membrane protein YqaA with SNARE-associated domain